MSLDFDPWSVASPPGEFEDRFADEDEDKDEDETRAEKVYKTQRTYAETSTTDAHVSARVCAEVLAGKYCRTPASETGWFRWDGKCWTHAAEDHLVDTVRRAFIKWHADEAKSGESTDRLKALSALLSKHRIAAVVYLCRGILHIDAEKFDQHPELLNVGNGVVDLTTATLRPHDPALLLTKVTAVDYRPGATSADWTSALSALPAEVAAWMQVRFGQAATGHPTSDDILPVMQGGGSNGKTTIVSAIARTLGDHTQVVPARLLLSNPSDHPTELMTLRGARFALIEELPEGRHLSVKRLKDTLGTDEITARHIMKNNVTWRTTHSLFLTTNYMPRIDETDHGTWRRLALVRFPYTYTDAPKGAADRLGIEGLRERIKEGLSGEHEAVLAWLVEGAKRWYKNGRVLPKPPQTVLRDTQAWRAEADLICGYITDRLVSERNRKVLTTELYQDFCSWIEGRGHSKWSDQTFTARFTGHSMVEAAKVEKTRTTDLTGLDRLPGAFGSISKQPQVWNGVRFRKDDDFHAKPENGPEQHKHNPVAGVAGVNRTFIDTPRVEKEGSTPATPASETTREGPYFSLASLAPLANDRQSVDLFDIGHVPEVPGEEPRHGCAGDVCEVVGCQWSTRNGAAS